MCWFNPISGRSRVVTIPTAGPAGIELAAGAEDVVIAYGGGGFSHNSRGHPPTPNKHLFQELKRRTRSRFVPEFRTSKLCSLYDNVLVQSDIWSIKSCNNPNCWTRWNRDVNVARNIRRVALYMNANGGRKPEAFQISGTRYSTKKAITWITADRDRHMAITLTPTPCCYNTDDYITHLLHELAAGAEDVVIAYGGGGFSHNSRGHPPTPNKHIFLELKRRTRCRLVPEFRTSKLCSLCDNLLVQSDIWSIKSCNNPNCWTRWNRDVNVARNIRRVALYMNANGGRKPEAFRRENYSDVSTPSNASM
ncbi:hypothetical protein MP638_007387 [Amoeboaphelidium occidentale]|nr:hypothetical protein MP638_007387 [Amoeboaphelidium occidentale]